MANTNKIGPGDAAGKMAAFKEPPMSGMTWSECLKLDYGREIVGEIRAPADWEKVPKDVKLRAVFINDQQGGAIRWGNSRKMEQILPGHFHAHLACRGDDLTDARYGWIEVSSDGEIIVS